MMWAESSSGATSGGTQESVPAAGTTPGSIPRTATEWKQLAGTHGLGLGSSGDTAGQTFHLEIEAMVVEQWSKALSDFWGFAKGERGNQLNGKYVRRTDGRGIDPISECWGMVEACEAIMPVLASVRLSSDTPVTPSVLRQDAQGVAEREYAHKIIEEARGE